MPQPKIHKTAHNVEAKLQLYVQSWANQCITIWGKKKLILSFALGSLSVLALPPINLFFVLFFTMPSLVWLLDGAVQTSLKTEAKASSSLLFRLWRKIYGARSAFWVGLSFGFGYFFFGLLWIGEAFLVDAAAHILMMPFAITLLPLLLAIFWGLATLTARLFWAGGVRNVIILAISFTFWEFLRGHIFSGFPWNLLGFAFDFSTAMLQSAAIWGIYGLTFIVTLLSLSMALMVNNGFTMRRVLLGVFGALIVMWAAGNVRLYLHPTQYHDDILLRLVQGNIAQKDKWRTEMRSVIANRYLELSARETSAENTGLSDITHLIWPESALPFLLTPNSSFMRQATRVLNKNAYLITGAVRRQIIEGKTEFFNSVLAFDAAGNRLGKYDKYHLVPFGEYLPLSDLFRKIGIDKLIAMQEDFETGQKPANIYLKNTPAFAVNICFEIIFSGQVVDAENRPDWILNVTNDSWFGNSIGPYQHLAQARLRTIEEGLPLVRNANSGITAIFDPLGRIVAQLPRGKAAILDSRLPQKISPTIFVKLNTFLKENQR
ncbi:MAG: apolipoprotein N-acyltransferase [Hyphomicrobiales bacterium]|nr:MAG: apolipoprotein N-acyltransferase [Hyphomicrobiales bacterium]